MHPLIRTSIALTWLCSISINSFAGGESVRPVKSIVVYHNDLTKLDSLLSPALVSPVRAAQESEVVNKEAVLSSSRICSCQVLNLESSNYDHRSVVLLSEKSNDGTPAAYSAAKNRLLKEKRLLKKMFYDKVKVVAEFQGAGSCKSMFLQLRSTDKNLQLYEILNAD